MMLGKCVIASDAPGLRSIVEDKKVGYLFHSGDAQDLLRVLRSTLMNAEQRLAIEREAMNTAERRFNLQARTAELMKALDSRIH